MLRQHFLDRGSGDEQAHAADLEPGGQQREQQADQRAPLIHPPPNRPRRLRLSLPLDRDRHIRAPRPVTGRTYFTPRFTFDNLISCYYL